MTPDDDTIAWIFETSTWWLESFGGFATFAENTSVVTPTEEDFPVDLDLEGAALVDDYFLFAKEHAGMTEWAIEMAEETAPDVAGALRGMPHHMTEAPRPAKSPRRVRSGEPLPIPYDISLLRDEELLVATMARGLSHYLLQQAPSPIPPDAPEHELVVELGAILMGFGVFIANACFRFEQHESGAMVGWGYRRSSGLNEIDASYALALVVELLDADRRQVEPHLRTNPRGFFASALRDLRKRRRDALEQLSRVEARRDGPYR